MPKHALYLDFGPPARVREHPGFDLDSAALPDGLSARYIFDDATAGAPAAGAMRLNHANPNSATQVVVSTTDLHSPDRWTSPVGVLFATPVVLQRYLLLVQENDPSKWWLYFVQAVSGVDNPITYTVSNMSGLATSFDDDAVIRVTAFLDGTHDHDADYSDIAHGHVHDHDADYADIAHSHTAPSVRRYPSGHYLYPSGCRAYTDNAGMTQNTVRAVPLLLSGEVTLSGIWPRLAGTAAGSTYYAGLYDDNGAGYPGALIAGGGVTPASGLGNREIAFDPDITLDPGQYWMAGVSRGGNPLIGRTGANFEHWDHYFTVDTLVSGAAAFEFKVGWVKAGDGAPGLPDPFPAGGSAETYTGILPLIAVRLA